MINQMKNKKKVAKIVNGLIQAYYPRTAILHGPLYVARLVSVLPILIRFFQKNRLLVPKAFRQELGRLDSNNYPIKWIYVFALRSAGRNDISGSFEDFGRGSEFSDAAFEICIGELFKYACESGLGCREESDLEVVTNGVLEQHACLAHSIIECERTPTVLLSWLLKVAATLETFRDLKEKSIDLNRWFPELQKLPAIAKQKLIQFIRNYISFICRHQDYYFVSLVDGERVILPANTVMSDYSVNLVRRQVFLRNKEVMSKGVEQVLNESSYYLEGLLNLPSQQQKNLLAQTLVAGSRVDLVAQARQQIGQLKLAAASDRSWRCDEYAENFPDEMRASILSGERPFAPELLSKALKSAAVLHAMACEIKFAKLGYVGLASAQNLITWVMSELRILIQQGSRGSMVRPSSGVFFDVRRDLLSGAEREVRYLGSTYAFPASDHETSSIAISASFLDCPAAGGESALSFLLESMPSAKEAGDGFNFPEIFLRMAIGEMSLLSSFMAEIFITKVFAYIREHINQLPQKVLLMNWFKLSSPYLAEFITVTRPFGVPSCLDTSDSKQLAALLLRRPQGLQFRINVSMPELLLTSWHLGKYASVLATFRRWLVDLLSSLRMAEKKPKPVNRLKLSSDVDISVLATYADELSDAQLNSLAAVSEKIRSVASLFSLIGQCARLDKKNLNKVIKVFFANLRWYAKLKISSSEMSKAAKQLGKQLVRIEDDKIFNLFACFPEVIADPSNLKLFVGRALNNQLDSTVLAFVISAVKKCKNKTTLVELAQHASRFARSDIPQALAENPEVLDSKEAVICLLANPATFRQDYYPALECLLPAAIKHNLPLDQWVNYANVDSDEEFANNLFRVFSIASEQIADASFKEIVKPMLLELKKEFPLVWSAFEMIVCSADQPPIALLILTAEIGAYELLPMREISAAQARFFPAADLAVSAE
jgi:hypothetical protein